VELAILTNDTYIIEGDTALLACAGYSYYDDVGLGAQVVWRHNDEVVTNSDSRTVYNEEGSLGERRYNQSIIKICDVGGSIAGSYICTVSNGRSSVSASTQLYAECEHHSMSHSLLKHA